MRYFYTLLFYLALPFLFLRLLWRSRKAPGYRRNWGERLGFFPHLLHQCVWVHAVSLGESIAAIPLIKIIKKRYPDLPILVTNMTPTGAACIQETFGNQVYQAYVPYDLPDAVDRFLNRVNPSIAVILETELWPNILSACKKRDIPVVITNARLSLKSAHQYSRIKSLTKEMLLQIKIIGAQTSKDAERFITLGAPKENVKVVGNLKFDIEIPTELANKSEGLRNALGNERLVWIAASTHEGEEKKILEAHTLICEKIKDSLLILVPRHPERFPEVAALVKQKGLTSVRRSLNETCHQETQVYIGDTMGEMMLMYSVSDVAYVGGSFVPVGGHNMLEPAVLGKPVITGPYLFNFTEISEMLLKAEGMIKIDDEKQLADKIMTLFKDPDYRKKIGENARRVIEANRGALNKQVELVLSLF